MSGFDKPWKQSWVREADKVKELAENNSHLRDALVKAEEECATYRQRAEEAEEVVGDLRSIIARTENELEECAKALASRPPTEGGAA